MWLSIYLIVINIAAFAAFGYDKHQARTGGWRVPERTLLLMAVIGGSIGALAGMYYFHHKTRHNSFRLGVPAILVIQIVILRFLLGTR